MWPCIHRQGDGWICTVLKRPGLLEEALRWDLDDMNHDLLSFASSSSWQTCSVEEGEGEEGMLVKRGDCDCQEQPVFHWNLFLLRQNLLAYNTY